MKKLFFASLWALACLAAACSDEKDEPNGESGSVVGEWVFQKNEYYRNGKMIDSFTAVEDEDKMIAVFREDWPFRYYYFPPEEYYDGTYSYDEDVEFGCEERKEGDPVMAVVRLEDEDGEEESE